MKPNLRLVVDNTRNEIEPYVGPNEDHEIPLLDLKEELTGNDKRNGYIGWIATGAVVAAWDFSRNETMTNAFRRAVEGESQLKRTLALGGLAVTAAHLLRIIPTEIDPFDNIARLLGRLKN